MLLKELIVLTEAKRVHRVPQGTFGDKPTHKDPMLSKFSKPMPVIDDEFGRLLYDVDLVDEIIDQYTDDNPKFKWKNLSDLEQIKAQLSFIGGPPKDTKNLAKNELALTKRAQKILDSIK